MKKYSKITVTSLTLILLAGLFFPSEAEEKDNGKWYKITRIRGEVKQLVIEKKFNQLEKMVSEARTKKLKFETVTWVLHDLYNGIPFSIHTFEGIYEFIDEWKKNSPKSNIPYIIEARVYMARAWEVRGTALTKNLSSNENIGFKNYLTKSWVSINAAEKKGPVDAELCTVKTTLSFLHFGDKKLARENFDKCTDIEPGYIHLYLTMVNYLQPNWYGSNEEMLEFVEESANNTKQIYGDGLYSLLVYSRTYNTNEIFIENGGMFSWERTRKGFQDILRKYGESSYILHGYGFLAMLADDHKVFAEVLMKTGTEWDESKKRYYKRKSWYEYHLSQAKPYLENSKKRK